MFGKLLKGLVVAAGVGFAVGMTAGKRLPAKQNYAIANSPDGLARLDRIESRLSAFEAQPSPVATTELDLRTQEQSGDIEVLRLQMSEHRQRIASDVAVIQKGLADITRSVPAMLEAMIAPRVDDLRLHLRSETQQSVDASLTAFERSIEEKVSARIAALEKVMLDQSVLVTALSQRAIASDMNLERLIAAVGRLCDRTENPASARDTDFTGLAA